MEATAVVATASGKAYYRNGGNLQKDEPSNSKKGKLLVISNGCKEIGCTVPGDDWDSRSERRANGKEISNIDPIDLLAPSCSVSEDTNREGTHSQSSGFEESIDYVFLNETYSIRYSDSKLKNESHTHLNSELEPEMKKKEEVFFDLLEHQGNRTSALEGSYRISDYDYKETFDSMRWHDPGEDSQQEYHSAEEQEYISDILSFDQTKALSRSNLEVGGLRNSGYEAQLAGNLVDDHVKLGSGSVLSLDSADGYGQEDVSKFQNSAMLREYHGLKHENCKEQETSLTYRTILDEIILSSTPENQESQSKSDFLNPQKASKTKVSMDELKSQITESKDFCGSTTGEKNMLQPLEDPRVLPQEKAFEVLLEPYKDCQTSWTSAFDDSRISACGYSHYQVLQNTSDSALDFSGPPPRIAVKDNQAAEDSYLAVANSNATNQTCSRDMQGTCLESAVEAAGCTVTVNQTVDVSADFRACFTTSRATSARPSVVSTSSNTEITMMNKKRPSEWQSEKQRSVACNTDWSHSQDCRDAQMAVTEGPGKSLSVDSLKPSGHVLNKDSLELRKTFDNADLKKHPEREVPLSKEMGKSLPAQCCQEAVQRAVKAELYLLRIHYQMCHRHCWDIYRLVMENKEGVKRNLTNNSAKKELGSALLSLLGDLKARYVSLKEKINKGIPLEELPPLSVESKLLSIFSAFASKLIEEETHVLSGAESELDNQNVHDDEDSLSLRKTLSQMSLSDHRHPKQDASPKNGGSDNGDINEGFSQLRLDDQDCKDYQEMSEDWFDAKENLTGVDVSGIRASQAEHDRCSTKLTPGMKNAESLRRDKGYLIHVGGLCPSVSEDDLKSLFQKYQVSEISIYGSSTNYRYASLAFKKNSDAKRAVTEMNGMEIGGKSVKVRLVKTPGEYTSPLASKNGSRMSVNNVERSTNKEINSVSCISQLPRTRPRHLGSKPDSEFFPFDQKGVKKNCKEIESAKLLPETLTQAVPSHPLNLRSLTKIMQRLAELHPEVSRDQIISALQEVRQRQEGRLNGLSVNTIVEMTSSVLKSSASI
ncbi:RNA-binding protein 44 [Orycteropus afer afer]|uniref:RNA-binding protein 44 n=1 Tax=Orycteropus afer afer TaxID=1230840 RepID=A0A8B7A6L2_ORYAF|nr:RNA-binding protein 44 [Orycteropus afer afer]